jgi:hypothetical protein
MSLLSWNGSFSWCRFQCCPSNIRHEKKTIRWGIDDIKYYLKHEQQCFIRYLRYEAKSSIFRSNKTSAVRRSCRSPGGFSDAGAGAEFCMPEPGAGVTFSQLRQNDKKTIWNETNVKRLLVTANCHLLLMNSS